MLDLIWLLLVPECVVCASLCSVVCRVSCVHLLGLSFVGDGVLKVNDCVVVFFVTENNSEDIYVKLVMGCC